MLKELKLPCLYKVTLDTKTSIYSFITFNNVEYDIVFIDATGYYTNTSCYNNINYVYSLYVISKNEAKPPKDIETQKTIDSILQHFFKDPEKSLLYECETKDKRELSRYRTFNKWYSQSEISVNLIKIDKPVIDNFGITHYTSLIYHKDNSYRDSLEVSHYEVLESYSKDDD